jgi:hypothetical protein
MGVMRDASESHGDGGVTAWNAAGADVRMTREQIAEAQRLSRELKYLFFATPATCPG